MAGAFRRQSPHKIVHGCLTITVNFIRGGPHPVGFQLPGGIGANRCIAAGFGEDFHRFDERRHPFLADDKGHRLVAVRDRADFGRRGPF